MVVIRFFVTGERPKISLHLSNFRVKTGGKKETTLLCLSQGIKICLGVSVMNNDCSLPFDRLVIIKIHVVLQKTIIVSDRK